MYAIRSYYDKNGDAIFTSCDSAKRYKSIYSKAAPICFILKKLAKVSRNSLQIPLLFDFAATSLAGLGNT